MRRAPAVAHICVSNKKVLDERDYASRRTLELFWEYIEQQYMKEKEEQSHRESEARMGDTRECIDGDPAEITSEVTDEVQPFKCVSRVWYSLISSRYLTNLFLNFPSSEKKRPVFMYFVDKEAQYNKALVWSPHNSAPFVSPYDSLPVFDLDQDLNMSGIVGCFENALRGLVCFRIGIRVLICNLTTRQRVLLPIIRSTIPTDNVWSYFGYDPIKDEYKVLCTIWEEERTEHQVLVLGHGASWRNTQSHTIPPHHPYSKGISINSVLYYGAWIDKNTCVVMSFDMRSEEFSLIELPIEASDLWTMLATNLMNYKEKLAVFEYSNISITMSIDVWVLEDAGKSRWSDKKSYLLPMFKLQTVSMSGWLLIKGTSHSCEIWLQDQQLHLHNSRSLIYDLERNQITRHIHAMNLFDRFCASRIVERTFWDDIESIMYLET